MRTKVLLCFYTRLNCTEDKNLQVTAWIILIIRTLTGWTVCFIKNIWIKTLNLRMSQGRGPAYYLKHTHTLMKCQVEGCSHHYTSLKLITCPTGSLADSLDWVTASSSAQRKLNTWHTYLYCLHTQVTQRPASPHICPPIGVETYR